MTAVYEQFRIKLAQKLRQKPVSAKVAETLVETCFCQDGLNRFKPRFKPVLAETCQPWWWHTVTSSSVQCRPGLNYIFNF